MLNIQRYGSKILPMFLLLSACTVSAQTNLPDKLAYRPTSIDGKAPLMVYDPQSHSSSLLRNDVEFDVFDPVVMSINGQLAK